MVKTRLIQFKVFKDVESFLTPIEDKELPFKVKRVFYIYNIEAGDIRGGHTHKKCKQLLICLQGKIKVVCDDGKVKKNYILCHPTIGLYVPPMVWATQHFQVDDSILLVLTDQYYDQSDYIHDYKKFKEKI